VSPWERERRTAVHTIEKGWVEGRHEALIEGGCKGCLDTRGYLLLLIL